MAADPTVDRWGVDRGLILPLCLFGVLLAGGLVRAWRVLGGYAFPLDDGYIHLAMARTFRNVGVWGPTPYESASASSSPAWTVLLAAIGPRPMVALALNVVSGVGALVAANLVLARLGRSSAMRAVTLAAVVGLVPLSGLALIGMEHTLHLLVALALLAALVGRLDGSIPDTRRRQVTLAALCAASPFVRLETLFLAGAAAAVLIVCRRWRPAVAVVAGTALGLATMAAGFLRVGLLPLPASVLLKSSRPDLHTAGQIARWATRWMGQATTPAAIGVALLAMLAVGLVAVAGDRRRRALVAVVVLALVAHLQLAGVGWLYRYEAYLVGLVVVMVGAVVPTHWRGARAVALGVGVVAAALVSVPRAAFNLRYSIDGAVEIRQQSVWSARFVDGPLADRAVVVNDLGAMAWISQARIVDAYGLGSSEVAHAILDGDDRRAAVDRLVGRHDVRVAIVFRMFAEGHDWTPVGHWTVPRTAVVGNAVVQVYAVREADADALTCAFHRFSRTRPEGVSVELDRPLPTRCPKGPFRPAGR